jgi:glycosyltransferase involved in cell wall biosynthesis
MPVFNGARFLREALDSLLSQSFEEFQLIISDNASTDETETICREYENLDRRVGYHRSPENRGATWNYNHVFQLAQAQVAPYFKWASHDDLCAASYLERCIETLDSYPQVVLCYARTAIIGEDGGFVKYYPDDLNLRAKRPSERYRHFHRLYRHPRLCNPIFGVMRTNILAKTPLIGNYVSTDMVLLGELSLHGQFYEIPEALFLRRDHPQASVRAYPQYRDRAAWFDPHNKDKLQMNKWIWLREYLGGIRRAALPPVERRRCYLEMGQWVWWNLRGLTKDIGKAVAWPFINLQN